MAVHEVIDLWHALSIAYVFLLQTPPAGLSTYFVSSVPHRWVVVYLLRGVQVIIIIEAPLLGHGILVPLLAICLGTPPLRNSCLGWAIQLPRAAIPFWIERNGLCRYAPFRPLWFLLLCDKRAFLQIQNTLEQICRGSKPANKTRGNPAAHFTRITCSMIRVVV